MILHFLYSSFRHTSWLIWFLRQRRIVLTAHSICSRTKVVFRFREKNPNHCSVLFFFRCTHFLQAATISVASTVETNNNWCLFFDSFCFASPYAQNDTLACFRHTPPPPIRPIRTPAFWLVDLWNRLVVSPKVNLHIWLFETSCSTLSIQSLAGLKPLTITSK